jgi:prolipoprotein diacylglyceryl transferase
MSWKRSSCLIFIIKKIILNSHGLFHLPNLTHTHMLLSILWDIDPEIFNLPINWWIFGTISVRWYGLLFALGFLLGYYIVEKMFKKDGIQLEWLDKLFLYTMIATVVGAFGTCILLWLGILFSASGRNY